MDDPQFVTKIRRLHRTQGATLRFAETGMSGLYRLRSLLDQYPAVRLDERNKVVMMAVMMSRDWGGSHNRSYTVYGLSSIPTDDWLLALARDVESIELSEHGAKGIMSGRQKVRDESAGKLVDAVLTRDFVDEMWGWKVDAAGFLEELQALPIVVFRLTYNGIAIASAGIDGWSGRIVVDGQFGDELYTKPDQIQKVLRERMESILERLTTTAAE